MAREASGTDGGIGIQDVMNNTPREWRPLGQGEVFDSNEFRDGKSGCLAWLPHAPSQLSGINVPTHSPDSIWLP